MHLEKLSVLNFKNYPEAVLQFDKEVNCFTGKNGEGKTNLLDAIYYLCFCKSFFNAIDSQNIRHEEPFFVVEGMFKKNQQDDHIYCAVKRGQKKIFKKNKVDYDRLADHIGLFPAVMISPYDQELISEGSEIRRKFMDVIISQTNSGYLNELINYNKALQQRNQLLKYFFENNVFQQDALEIWDEQLLSLNKSIHNHRINFLKEFIPIFNLHYQKISGGKEEVSIEYSSHFSADNPEEIFHESIRKDRRKQYTHVGIHKDDLNFLINGYSLKKFASQGQQKSYLIALKLAQFDFIKASTGTVPLLLLDDIFDRIDDQRVQNLMELVNDHAFGQIFITDTDEERVPEIFRKINSTVKVFSVKNGGVSEV